VNDKCVIALDVSCCNLKYMLIALIYSHSGSFDE